ncbi:MAG: hypothetical protein V4736_01655 [Bdellovibrionota bacterium]
MSFSLRTYLFLVPLICGFSVFAAAAPATEDIRFDTFRVGHNLSATSDVLGRGQCSAGVQVLGCGVTNRFTLGTSPWLVKDYRMASIGVRYLLSEDGDNRWAIQSNYFKTFRKRNIQASMLDDYQMEALWLMLVRTLKMEDHYKVHINLHTNYYWDQKMPFSLRRPYPNANPLQVNLTTLHELELVGGWFSFIEVGFLDLLNAPLHGHMGSSIGKRMGRLSAHFGITMSGSYDGFFTPTKRFDYQQYLRQRRDEGYNSALDSEMVQYDYAIHPEFTVQYLF